MKNNNQQGSALMVVVTLMLVLSVVGMAILYHTEGDRDTTMSEMHVRGALYAAELALRQGERVLLAAEASSADTLLAHISTTSTNVVNPSIPLFPQARKEYDLNHLGTYLIDGSGVELVNQSVSLPGGNMGAGSTNARYSLYIRNNPNDMSVKDNNPGTDARGDNDFCVNLISVGWVTLGGGVKAVKILEEEYTWDGSAQDWSVQKGSNASGDNFGGTIG